MKTEMARRQKDLNSCNCSTDKVRENLLGGIRHYRDLASRLVAGQKEEFSARLEALRSELDRIR